jgi:gliding motility-associated-like protein/uncharacterized repeat protein (TIGR01451 family)
MTPSLPSYSKGKPRSYTITPELPSGISLNALTGVISGTPTVLQTTAVQYTITAKNLGGSASAKFTLTINDVPPRNLKYNPNSMLSEQGKSISSMTPSSQGGAVVSYSIVPQLPSGLQLNSQTGVITGSRTQALSGRVQYTVTAANSGGTTTSTVTFIFNTTPTDIGLSKANIYEKNKIGDVVGLLSTTDIDLPETHTYSLVKEGVDSLDNRYFKISGNRLVADSVFTHSVKSSFVIRVRTTDSEGLFTEKKFTITVSRLPLIYGTHSEAYYYLSSSSLQTRSLNPVISKGYSSQLEVVGDDIRSVAWAPPTGLSSSISLKPVFNHPSSVTFTVTVTNIYGSVTQIPFTVEVKDDYFIKPSNILTTRQDGFNDFFVVENIQSYPDNEVTIYDRNGKILIKLNNYNNRWDGKVNGKLLATDTYYYTIRFNSKSSAIKRGFITIITN